MENCGCIPVDECATLQHCQVYNESCHESCDIMEAMECTQSGHCHLNASGVCLENCNHMDAAECAATPYCYLHGSVCAEKCGTIGNPECAAAAQCYATSEGSCLENCDEIGDLSAGGECASVPNCHVHHETCEENCDALDDIRCCSTLFGNILGSSPERYNNLVDCPGDLASPALPTKASKVGNPAPVFRDVCYLVPTAEDCFDVCVTIGGAVAFRYDSNAVVDDDEISQRCFCYSKNIDPSAITQNSLVETYNCVSE
jgi:hypothetical protein